MTGETITILSADEIRRTLNRLASEVVEKIDRLDELVLLGIHTRGVPLARQLSRQIASLEGSDVAVGDLDITHYRDDLDRIGVRVPERTRVPCDLSRKIVVLVDDVIYSGRTIRAALNATLEYGRPEAIYLLVLVDRGHRQLPIHPDFTGKRLPTAREEQIKVYLQPIDAADRVELVRPR